MADAVRLSGSPAAISPRVEHGKQRKCEQGGGRDHDEELVSIVHERVLSRMAREKDMMS